MITRIRQIKWPPGLVPSLFLDGLFWGSHTYIHMHAVFIYPPQPMIQMDEMSRSWKFDDSSVEDVYVTTWGWTFVGNFAVINHSTKFSHCFCGHEFAFICFHCEGSRDLGRFFFSLPHMGNSDTKGIPIRCPLPPKSWPGQHQKKHPELRVFQSLVAASRNNSEYLPANWHGNRKSCIWRCIFYWTWGLSS